MTHDELVEKVVEDGRKVFGCSEPEKSEWAACREKRCACYQHATAAVNLTLEAAAGYHDEKAQECGQNAAEFLRGRDPENLGMVVSLIYGKILEVATTHEESAAAIRAMKGESK